MPYAHDEVSYSLEHYTNHARDKQEPLRSPGYLGGPIAAEVWEAAPASL